MEDKYLYKNHFGKLKHVKIDLEKYRKHDGDVFELRSSDGLYWAMTYKKDEKYINNIYAGSLAKFLAKQSKAYLIVNKESETIEKAVQFHFDALNWLNEQGYSIS